jgi:DNA helicase HerA-like ATPase
VNRNLILSIFGRKGSGKTELSRKIMREYRRVIATDTVAQYGERDGFTVCYGKSACAAALKKAEHQEEFRLSLRSDDTEELLALMAVEYEFTDVLTVVDEAPFYCSPSKLPREMSLLVRQGRHHRISQIYIAQRPSEIHRSITSQSDIIVSFNQREERDVKYLVENGGGRDAERVSELPKYRLIAFGDGMDGPDVPVAVLAQRFEFSKRDPNQLDLGV